MTTFQILLLAWLLPALVCAVSFTRWTRSIGRLTLHLLLQFVLVGLVPGFNLLATCRIFYEALSEIDWDHAIWEHKA